MGISAATASAIAAGVGATAAVGGAGLSYKASQDSSKAASNAQNQSIAAQSQAFDARHRAQVAQLEEQTALQNRSQERYSQAQQSMRSEQEAAQGQRQAALDKMNAEQQQLTDQSRATVEQATGQAITPQSLQDAQARSEQARMAGVTPAAENIRASSPLPSAIGKGETKSALAGAMADAADYTEKYGGNLAKLGAFSAPATAVGQATGDLKYGLLPIAAQDQLLRSGARARLLPGENAYQQATSRGRSLLDANTMRTNEEMGVSKMRQQNAEDLANLGQDDTNANIQTGLNLSQARAASLNSLGKGASAVGDAGIQYGAANGAFSNLFGSGVPGSVGTPGSKGTQFLTDTGFYTPLK